METESGRDQPAEIIVISWQSQGQQGRADMYYHADCYKRCPVALPDGEKSGMGKDEIARHIKCASCGWYLNF